MEVRVTGTKEDMRNQEEDRKRNAQWYPVHIGTVSKSGKNRRVQDIYQAFRSRKGQLA